jgi:8-oxo-dGTP diphosphatase
MVAAARDIHALHVAAGVLQDEAGRVLIAQRPAKGHMGGAWEFPGGKIESGETPLEGLVRELAEELSVQVLVARHLTRYQHDYGDHRIKLYVWKVLEWQGEPRGVEGQPLRWLRLDELMQAGLLPADESIVELLMDAAAINEVAHPTLCRIAG